MSESKNVNKSFHEILNDRDAIFHYTKRCTGMEMILQKGCLRFGRLINTNDPFEYKNKLLGVSGWSWTEETNKNIAIMHRYSDSILRNASYFSSFSVNKYNQGSSVTQGGHQKSRMWSQYGEDHFGMCLIFSKEKLIKVIEESINQKKFIVHSGDIQYKTIGKGLKTKDISINGDSFNGLSPFDVAFEHIKKHQNELFFCKMEDYSDEDEYRVVICSRENKNIHKENIDIKINDCISGIILGDRFPKVYKPSIEALCDKLNIQYKKAHWEHERFVLLSSL